MSRFLGNTQNYVRMLLLVKRYWELIADISAKPAGVGAASQLLTEKVERSGLLMLIAATVNASLCTRMKS